MKGKTGTFWKNFWRLAVGGLLFFQLVSGCATSYDARGVFHKVRRGETMAWIANRYGVGVQELAELNDIREAKRIRPGQKLYLPGRSEKRFKKLPFEEELRKNLPQGKRSFENRFSKKGKEEIVTDYSRFAWPVEGKVVSPFGIRKGRRHDGIDIKASRGTTIRAAADGRIVFAGRMRGYGNLVLVRHKDHFFTAYAHNRVNQVKKGKWVKKGEVLGLVGSTGRSTGPHLHFEIREGEKARNPLFFLPVAR